MADEPAGLPFGIIGDASNGAMPNRFAATPPSLKAAACATVVLAIAYLVQSHNECRSFFAVLPIAVARWPSVSGNETSKGL